jgi:hypothetical protein
LSLLFHYGFQDQAQDRVLLFSRSENERKRATLERERPTENKKKKTTTGPGEGRRRLSHPPSSFSAPAFRDRKTTSANSEEEDKNTVLESFTHRGPRGSNAILGLTGAERKKEATTTKMRDDEQQRRDRPRAMPPKEEGRCLRMLALCVEMGD